MNNLQNLRIFFFRFFPCMFLWIISATSLAPAFDGTTRIARHLANIDKKDKQKKTIDFTEPLRQCWFLANNKIEADKIASDNDLMSDEILVNKLSGGIVFLPSFDGKVSAIDTYTSKKVWETNLGGAIISNLSVDDKNVYVLSKAIYYTNPENRREESSKNNSDNNTETQITIRSLNKKSGLTEWQTNITLNSPLNKKGTEAICRMALAGTSLIFYCDGGAGFSVNKNRGSLQWQKSYLSLLSVGSILADDLLITKNSREIFVVSIKTGDIVETLEKTERATAIFYRFDRKRIIYGDDKGTISSLILGNEKLQSEWTFRIGAGVITISPTMRGTLISSLDNFLYMISENDGRLIWKKRMAGRIIYKPFVQADYAMVTNASEPIASVLDLKTGKIVNKIILEDGNFFISEPIRIGDKLLLFTQRGMYAFSDSSCTTGLNKNEIEKRKG